MSELRYPNESQEYRKAREALLKDEQELVDKMKAVAAKRRKLPPGGQLKEDYTFQWARRRQGRAAREILRAVRRQDHAAFSTHGCSARAGTSPARPARR